MDLSWKRSLTSGRRIYLESSFRAYRENRFPHRWKPGESDRWLTLYSEDSLELPTSFHFVMANFCPWNPPHQHPRFEEFYKLRSALPASTLWVGHGNYDVHALFMEL